MGSGNFTFIADLQHVLLSATREFDGMLSTETGVPAPNVNLKGY